MTLYEKIIAIYPELAVVDLLQNPFVNGTITLQNDSDDKGDYIKFWNHPTLPRPTDEELA